MSTFPDFSRQALAQSANKPFLVGPEPLTYGELRRRLGRLTALFQDAGLEPGDAVMLAVSEDAACIELLLALLLNGLVPLIVNPEARRREAALWLEQSAPVGFILDQALFSQWGLESEVTGARFTLRVGRPPKANLLGKLFKRPAPAAEAGPLTYPAVLATLVERPLPAPQPAENLAWVLFTSGTTTRPKGVEITRGALQAHLATLTRQFGYDAESRLLNPLPLFHADGLVQGPLLAFVTGGTLCRPMPFGPQALEPFLDTLYSQRVTHFVAVPTMLALITRFGQGLEDTFQTEDLRCVVSTAAHLESHLWIEFETRFRTRVTNVYGLTETVAGSLFCGPDERTRRPGTLGKPVDCEARVLAPDGSPVAPGEVGELWLKGPHLMAGYHGDPVGTALVLQGGWLATGDQVRQDEDGFFHVMGRLKHVIISGGRNIAPEEVTEVLNGHPDVLEAAVIGLEEPDWGEKVVACVVGAVDAEALRRYCHEHLSAYKVPQRFVVVDALPKGPSGKVRLEAVRALVAERERAPAGGEGPAVEHRLLAIAARCFQTDAAALSPASGPHNTLGWTSLAHMELVVAIEKAFGVTLGTRDVMKLQSLADAAGIVRRHLEANPSAR